MEFSGNDLKGLGLIGQYIVTLIDRGEKESLELIQDKMVNGTLLNYIFKKYPSRMKFEEGYDLETLNAFFSHNSPAADSDTSGVFGEDNGLLAILAVILNEVEHRIMSW